MSDQESFGVRAKRTFVLCAQFIFAIIFLPFLLYGLHLIGIGGYWPSGIVVVVSAIAMIKPFPVPFMDKPVISKSMVFGALFGMFAVWVGTNNQERKALEAELANLKIFSPEVYVDKLKFLGRDDEWLTALKDIRPEEYVAEKARQDEAIQLRQAQKAEQGRRDRIKQLHKRAGDEGRNGITLKASDYEGTWNLNVTEGRLSCKQGPMANGKPRPLVLFDAGGKSYGINGAAMTNGYADARTLLAGDAGVPPYDDKMLDPLLKAGLSMCKATLNERCGDRIEAITYAQIFVKKRLKSPSGADFSLLNTRTGMSECGTWNIVSYVDAKNSFGVEIRTPYAASVTKQAKSKWVLNVLEMN